jgi:phage gp29-like protein
VVAYLAGVVNYLLYTVNRKPVKAVSFPFGGAVSNLVRAVGELPASIRRGKQVPAKAAAGDLAGRQVPANALSDWWLGLPDVLSIPQISALLRGAAAGSLWQQAALGVKIADTWPTYRRCLNTLRTAAKMVNYKVTPFTVDESTPPTKSAVEKADFVRRSFGSFEPDRFKEEDNFKGMVYDLTDAIPNGISITELLWSNPASVGGGKLERTVRASGWVNPRYIAVQADGSVGVADDGRGEDNLSFPGSVVPRKLLNDPRKFMVAKHKSKSGSFLMAGEMRCIATAWLNIVFAMDWMRNFGQKFGNPFMAIPYMPGISQSEIDQFEAAAARCAAQGFIVYAAQSDSMKPTVIAPQSITADNPIRVMISLAEKWCEQLFLGQTLTSDTGDQGKGGGSYGLGKVHGEVKQEKLEAVTDWVAEVLEYQFATTLLTVNYGDAKERPRVTADFTHIESPQEAAVRMGTITTTCKMPVVAEEAYKVVGLKQPQPGDQVLVNGVIQVQGEALTEEEKFEQQLERQVQQAKASMALQSEAQGGAPVGGEQEPEQVEARAAASSYRLRAALSKATAEQLAKVEQAVVKCKVAGTGNGEWKNVVATVDEISKTNRMSPRPRGLGAD